MRRNRVQGAVLALVLALLGATAGCTGTDPLEAGNFTVTFEAGTVSGAGMFECVLLDFLSFRVQPLDPVALQSLGGQPDVGILTAPSNFVDFLPEVECGFVPGATLPSRTLPSGDYRIVALTVGNPKLFDEESGNFAQCSGSMDISNSYAAPLIFRVGAARPNAVRFKLNVPLLQKALQSFGCDAFFKDITSILEIQ